MRTAAIAAKHFHPAHSAVTIRLREMVWLIYIFHCEALAFELPYLVVVIPAKAGIRYVAAAEASVETLAGKGYM